MNCDGIVDAADAAPFAMALVSPDDYAASFPACQISAGDGNQDGFVDGRDVQFFVEAILTEE